MVVSLSLSSEKRSKVLLNLGNGHRRKKLGKKEKEKQEEAKRSRNNPELHPAGGVKTPVVGEEVLGHGSDDDHETLGPHADIDQNGDGEKPPQVRPDSLEKKEKRSHCIADDHDPEHEPVMADGPEEESLLFEDVAAVPGHEVFDDVGIADDNSGEDGSLGNGLKISQGDDLFEMKEAPQRNQ
jgi:hypothetical protein